MNAEVTLKVMSDVQGLLRGDTKNTSASILAELESMIETLTEEVGSPIELGQFTVAADVIRYDGQAVAFFLPMLSATLRYNVERALLDYE